MLKENAMEYQIEMGGHNFETTDNFYDAVQAALQIARKNRGEAVVITTDEDEVFICKFN